MLLKCNQSKEQPDFEVVDTSEYGEFVSDDRNGKVKVSTVYKLESHSSENSPALIGYG